MVNAKVVVWDREPAVPVTVIVDDPVGVDADVVTVSVDEHAGLHEAGENAAVAPVGSPEAENDTDCAVPETSAAVIVLDTDCPGTTVLFPPLESEKSKDGGGGVELIVNVRVAVSVPPLLLALSVTVNVPAVAGVPEINPVPLLIDSPAGSPLAP